MSDSAFPDRPMSEDEWLAMFRRSDVRSARYDELMETLFKHPDRDNIIAREMGWDHEPPIDSETQLLDFLDKINEPVSELDAAFDIFISDNETANIVQDEEAESSVAPIDEEDDDVWPYDDDSEAQTDDLPVLSKEGAYLAAMGLGKCVVRLDRDDKLQFLDPNHDELFRELFLNALTPAMKIRGGHSYGYDERICANIVCNRFALEAVERADTALRELNAANVLPPVYADEMLPRLRELRQLLTERIAELRRRVWW